MKAYSPLRAKNHESNTLYQLFASPSRKKPVPCNINHSTHNVMLSPTPNAVYPSQDYTASTDKKSNVPTKNKSVTDSIQFSRPRTKSQCNLNASAIKYASPEKNTKSHNEAIANENRSSKSESNYHIVDPSKYLTKVSESYNWHNKDEPVIGLFHRNDEMKREKSREKIREDNRKAVEDQIAKSNAELFNRKYGNTFYSFDKGAYEELWKHPKCGNKSIETTTINNEVAELYKNANRKEHETERNELSKRITEAYKKDIDDIAVLLRSSIKTRKIQEEQIKEKEMIKKEMMRQKEIEKKISDEGTRTHQILQSKNRANYKVISLPE